MYDTRLSCLWEGSPNTLHRACNEGPDSPISRTNQKMLSIDQFPFRQIHKIMLPCSSHDKSVTGCGENSCEFPSCLFSSTRNFSGSIWWEDHFLCSLRLPRLQGFHKKLLLQEVLTDQLSKQSECFTSVCIDFQECSCFCQGSLKEGLQGFSHRFELNLC